MLEELAAALALASGGALLDVSGALALLEVVGALALLVVRGAGGGLFAFVGPTASCPSGSSMTMA